jgi:hypothetical protein
MFARDQVHRIDRTPPLVDLLIGITDVNHRAFHSAEDAEDHWTQILRFVHHDVVDLGSWTRKRPQLR